MQGRFEVFYSGMDVTSDLLTVADFSRLAQSTGGLRQELHHGELVELPPVKKKQTKIQKQLIRPLEAGLTSAQYGVDKEFPFRPTSEYEVWVADVAVFDLDTWERTADDDYLRGVPAIVIEVLRPSNSDSEMLDREAVCLRHGGREFWMVDPGRETVRVVRGGGVFDSFDVTGVIESPVIGRPIRVCEIFH